MENSIREEFVERVSGDPSDPATRLGVIVDRNQMAHVPELIEAGCNEGARALQAGMVWVNCYDYDDITMPFGVYKQSGRCVACIRVMISLGEST